MERCELLNSRGDLRKASTASHFLVQFKVKLSVGLPGDITPFTVIWLGELIYW